MTDSRPPNNSAADPHRACDRCLARSWLLGRLGGHLDRAGARVLDVMALPNAELIAALAGRRRAGIEHELRRLDLQDLRAREYEAGLELICHCDPAYPERLRALESPPAVLHVAGSLDRASSLLERETVAVVGARGASGYGREVARSLGRGLVASGVTVISGMALGIDSAAHAGAVTAHGATVAVLPGGADRPYPASRRALYNRIRATGAILSELPAGAPVRRWAPRARNRIIAGLAAITVVVEAHPRSGALLTAAWTRDLGRPLGAVPGRVTSELAAGPNGLIRSGAALIRSAQDVLDELFGEGTVSCSRPARPPLPEDVERLLAAIREGHDTLATLMRHGFGAGEAMAGLSELELMGFVRRGPGGRFEVVP